MSPGVTRARNDIARGFARGCWPSGHRRYRSELSGIPVLRATPRYLRPAISGSRGLCPLAAKGGSPPGYSRQKMRCHGFAPRPVDGQTGRQIPCPGHRRGGAPTARTARPQASLIRNGSAGAECGSDWLCRPGRAERAVFNRRSPDQLPMIMPVRASFSICNSAIRAATTSPIEMKPIISSPSITGICRNRRRVMDSRT
jgi:hypothetical protein